MPLVIPCDQCRREIKVSSRFAGRVVSCPHCKAKLQVPDDGAKRQETALEAASTSLTAVVAPPAPPDAPPAPPPPVEPSLPVDWQEQPLAPPPRYAEPARSSQDTIQVSRTVVLMQGALLAVMAASGFVAGVLLARSYGTSQQAAPQPCFLTGKVLVQRVDGNPTPDAGAVALLFPQAERPDRGAKISIAGLRPHDADPSAVGQSDQALRSIGADICRVSDDGFFHLRVRDVGKYYVLVLSNRVLRDTSEPLDRRMLAELGRYVDRANELIGPNAFQWRELDVRGDDQFTVTFR